MAKKTPSEKRKPGYLENGHDSRPVESNGIYSQKLDKLISKMYTFVEVDEKVERQPIIEPCAVDHTISFNFLPATVINEKHSVNKKMRIWKPKPKFFEKITYEDMCSVVVSGDWILNKQGIYGNGRVRRSELVTGAVHSSAVKKKVLK